MLAGPASPPPQLSTSVEAHTMGMVMHIKVKGSPLRPHSLVDAFMAIHHEGPTRERTLVVAPLFGPATTSALAVVQAATTNLPLVVDILSSSIVANIATPVASPPDARVHVPIGGVVLEGIPPPSFFLYLETGVDSMLPTRSGSLWPEGFTLESDNFF